MSVSVLKKTRAYSVDLLKFYPISCLSSLNLDKLTILKDIFKIVGGTVI